VKKQIAASVLTVLVLSTGGFLTLTHAQSPGADLKPTYLNPIPGLYVNGWPAFTVTCPKEWETVPPISAEVFRSRGTLPGSLPGTGQFLLAIGAMPFPRSVEDGAKVLTDGLRQQATGIKVLSDKPIQLKDGTPAREVEIEFVPTYDTMGHRINDGPTVFAYELVVKRDSILIWVNVSEDKTGPKEDLKKIAHSLTFLPGKEEPVAVPPDIREFLDMYRTDFMSRDVTSVMGHFSDRFLNSGRKKGWLEEQIRRLPPASPGLTLEPVVTVYEPREDRVYVDGFMIAKSKDDPNGRKTLLGYQQIIKEQGRWKWYGNQK
jgi:hypothetical protein